MLKGKKNRLFYIQLENKSNVKSIELYIVNHMPEIFSRVNGDNNSLMVPLFAFNIPNKFNQNVVLFLASIDCNTDECRKPMKIYEELGCKAIFGSKSCCPKRYECPDDVRIVKDENKCIYKGDEYKIGDLLPRSHTNESKCLEECVCSRSVSHVYFFLYDD